MVACFLLQILIGSFRICVDYDWSKRLVRFGHDYSTTVNVRQLLLKTSAFFAAQVLLSYSFDVLTGK